MPIDVVTTASEIDRARAVAAPAYAAGSHMPRGEQPSDSRFHQGLIAKGMSTIVIILTGLTAASCA